MSTGEDFRKRYGDRAAHDWYVKWRFLELEKRMARESEERRKEENRKMAELVAASTAISAITSIIVHFLLHKKSDAS